MRIHYSSGYKYQLKATYQHQLGLGIFDECETEFIALTKTGILTIKSGYAWDGASGPTIDTKTSMRGSLVHDALYQLIRNGHLAKECQRQADKIARQIWLEDGMWGCRANIWYRALITVGRLTANYKKPVQTAP